MNDANDIVVVGVLKFGVYLVGVVVIFCVAFLARCFRNLLRVTVERDHLFEYARHDLRVLLFFSGILLFADSVYYFVEFKVLLPNVHATGVSQGLISAALRFIPMVLLFSFFLHLAGRALDSMETSTLEGNTERKRKLAGVNPLLKRQMYFAFGCFYPLGLLAANIWEVLSYLKGFS